MAIQRINSVFSVVSVLTSFAESILQPAFAKYQRHTFFNTGNATGTTPEIIDVFLAVVEPDPSLWIDRDDQ